MGTPRIGRWLGVRMVYGESVSAAGLSLCTSASWEFCSMCLKSPSVWTGRQKAREGGGDRDRQKKSESETERDRESDRQREEEGERQGRRESLKERDRWRRRERETE